MSKPASQARRANILELYEDSVQNADHVVDFLDRTYQREHGRSPQVFREDFCGTALFAAEWVKSGEQRRAIGIDLDGPTLEEGWSRHGAGLTEAQRQRVELVQGDALQGCSRVADVIGAFNFSFQVFKERSQMLAYARSVRQGLTEGGAFFLDLFGGPEAQTELEEEREQEGYSYVWDQDSFDPITNDIRCHIHFRFPDGSELERAFTYEWRLWSLPELRDVLLDAGFSRVDVWWEGKDDVWRKVDQAPNWEAWIAYLVAWK